MFLVTHRELYYYFFLPKILGNFPCVLKNIISHELRLNPREVSSHVRANLRKLEILEKLKIAFG